MTTMDSRQGDMQTTKFKMWMIYNVNGCKGGKKKVDHMVQRQWNVPEHCFQKFKSSSHDNVSVVL